MKNRDGASRLMIATQALVGQAASHLRPQNAKVKERQTSYDLAYREATRHDSGMVTPPVTGKEK